MKRITSHTETRTVDVRVETETFNCDKCGAECTDDIGRADAGVPWMTKLEIYGDPDSCVSMRVKRHFCGDCVTDVVRAIITAIGVRPEQLNRESDEYDVYYGNFVPDGFLAGDYPSTWTSGDETNG